MLRGNHECASLNRIYGKFPVPARCMPICLCFCRASALAGAGADSRELFIGYRSFCVDSVFSPFTPGCQKTD